MPQYYPNTQHAVPDSTPIPDPPYSSTTPILDTQDLLPHLFNLNLAAPIEFHDHDAWQAGMGLGSGVRLHQHNEHIALESWPTQTNIPRGALGDELWPNYWGDAEDPSGDAASDLDDAGGYNHLHTLPNGDYYDPESEGIPNEGAYRWGAGQQPMSTHTTYNPPTGDSLAHQWTDDAWGDGVLHDVPSEVAQPEWPEPDKPEPLYNPYGDGAEPAYIRIDTLEKTIFRYASAGGIVQKASQDKTQWQKLREQHEALYEDNIYGPWGTKREWEDVCYFANAWTSQAGLQELLNTERFVSDPPDFGSVKKLFHKIENEMNDFGAPRMTVEEVRLAEVPLDQHLLAYLDIEAGGDYLFGNPRFDKKMVFAPVIEFGPDGVCQFGNVESADYWNLRQRLLQPGTTLGAVILMSDTTQLSMFSGDVSAHGVYMSLANIDKELRVDISEGAWLLVGIIPKSNWDKTLSALPGLSQDRRASLVTLLNRRLFHQCMEVITRPLCCTQPHEALDPAGNT